MYIFLFNIFKFVRRAYNPHFTAGYTEATSMEPHCPGLTCEQKG